ALVVLPDVPGGQGHRHQVHAVVVEGLPVLLRTVGLVCAVLAVAVLRGLVVCLVHLGGHRGGTVPADPGALLVGHDRGQRGHQAPRGTLPRGVALVVHHAVHRQPVGDHDEVVLAGGGWLLGGPVDERYGASGYSGVHDVAHDG